MKYNLLESSDQQDCIVVTLPWDFYSNVYFLPRLSILILITAFQIITCAIILIWGWFEKFLEENTKLS